MCTRSAFTRINYTNADETNEHRSKKRKTKGIILHQCSYKIQRANTHFSNIFLLFLKLKKVDAHFVALICHILSIRVCAPLCLQPQNDILRNELICNYLFCIFSFVLFCRLECLSLTSLVILFNPIIQRKKNQIVQWLTTASVCVLHAQTQRPFSFISFFFLLSYNSPSLEAILFFQCFYYFQMRIMSNFHLKFNLIVVVSNVSLSFFLGLPQPLPLLSIAFQMSVLFSAL